MQNLEKTEIENLCNDDVQDVVETSAESKKTRWFSAQKGATAIEYALIASLIAVAIITAVQTLGDNASDTFNTVSAQLG